MTDQPGPARVGVLAVVLAAAALLPHLGQPPLPGRRAGRRRRRRRRRIVAGGRGSGGSAPELEARESRRGRRWEVGEG